MILAQINDVVYVVGATEESLFGGAVELVSDRAWQVTGYAPQDFYDNPRLWLSLIHPDDLRDLRESTLRGVAGRKGGTREYRLRHRETGEYRWIEDRFVLRLDRSGRLTGLLGAARDVTDRKRAEEALRSRERRFQAMIENSLDAIALVDADGTILFDSPAVARIAGYAQGELVGRSFFEKLHPDDVETAARLFRQLRARPGSSRRAEVRFHHKDGSHRWLEAVATNLLDEPSVRAVVANYRDVTRRKQTEQTLRHLSSQLIQLQDEERRRIARELHDSTGQTLSALAMKLSALRRAASRSRSPVREALAESQALAEQCAREIRTLSYLLHPPLLDEAGLTSALRWLADGFTKRSGIRTDLQVDPDFGRLPREAETALFRVVQESLANIQRHSGSASAAVRLFRDEGEVLLEVEDHGRGMRPERAGAGDRCAAPGVGLAGMRERARELGGRLEIHHGAGGTRVRLVLPVPEGAP